MEKWGGRGEIRSRHRDVRSDNAVVSPVRLPQACLCIVSIIIVPGVVCILIPNPTFLIIMIPGVVCILIPNPTFLIIRIPGVVCILIPNPTFIIIMIPGVVCILIPNPTFLIITITGDMCSLDHFFAWPLLPHWIRIHVAEYLLLSG